MHHFHYFNSSLSSLNYLRTIFVWSIFIKFSLQIQGLIEEKNQLFESLEREKGRLAESEEQVSKLNAAKADLERQLQELSDRISEVEDRNADLGRQKKKNEQEINELKKKNQVLPCAIAF